MQNEPLNDGKAVLLYIMVDNALSEDEAVSRALKIIERYTPLEDHSLIEGWADERSGRFLIKLGEIVHIRRVEQILDEAMDEE